MQNIIHGTGTGRVKSCSMLNGMKWRLATVEMEIKRGMQQDRKCNTEWDDRESELEYDGKVRWKGEWKYIANGMWNEIPVCGVCYMRKAME